MTAAFHISSLILIVFIRQLKKAFDPMPSWAAYGFLLALAAFLLISPVIK